MAAASQVPAGTCISKSWCVELIALVNEAKDLGIAAAGDTVTTLLANLATERDAR